MSKLISEHAYVYAYVESYFYLLHQFHYNPKLLDQSYVYLHQFHYNPKLLDLNLGNCNIVRKFGCCHKLRQL